MAVKPHQAFFWLHQHDRQNYQRWNELVAGFKSAVLNVAPLGADLYNLGALTLDDSTVGVIGS
jgi:hypothetical protein